MLIRLMLRLCTSGQLSQKFGPFLLLLCILFKFSLNLKYNFHHLICYSNSKQIIFTPLLILTFLEILLFDLCPPFNIELKLCSRIYSYILSHNPILFCLSFLKDTLTLSPAYWSMFFIFEDILTYL